MAYDTARESLLDVSSTRASNILSDSIHTSYHTLVYTEDITDKDSDTKENITDDDTTRLTSHISTQSGKYDKFVHFSCIINDLSNIYV